MSNRFKPGDKVRCIRGSRFHSLDEGAVYTVSSVRLGPVFIDLKESPWKGWDSNRFELVETSPKPSSFSSDVAAFVADVEAGRIERGGVPGKYRVFYNDDNNVVVEFFN